MQRGEPPPGRGVGGCKANLEKVNIFIFFYDGFPYFIILLSFITHYKESGAVVQWVGTTCVVSMCDMVR